MEHYTSLSADVEAEYDAFCMEPDRNMDVFYEKLFRYLKYMTWKFMNESRYVDETEIEDIANEVLAYVATNVLHSFQKEQAMFATYCAQIVKNKVWNWKKKRSRMLLDLEGDLEQEPESSECSLLYRSPERLVIEYEERLEMIELVKKYITILMDWKQKPYRTVSCGFTMILFQKYHPYTKELTSPKWAYENLKQDRVWQGAERFLKEMREWMPQVPLRWSNDFLDAMDELQDNIYIGELIFGEHFTVKDFENWSLRLREKIKRQLIEAEAEYCFQ
ncbi:MAG: hypothetical protein IJ282_06200 [Lachnospiraceae bacterium]|nr:hypothetical protein [Lachnospiraceae bacterium]